MWLSRRVSTVVLAAAMLAASESSLAQQPTHLSGEEVEKLCTEADKVPVPTGLLPTAAQAAKLAPSCSPLDLYYASTPGHLEETRLCGLAQWQRDVALDARHVESPRISSSQFLAIAMVFANGEGAPRNIPLARRFACLAGDDGFTDVDNVLTAIDGGKLEVCSEDGSFFGRQPNYECLLVLQARITNELEREEDRAERTLPRARMVLWQALANARSDYLDAHLPELPNGNTGATQSGMDDMLNLDRAWIEVLRSIEKGELPQGFANAATFAEVDKQLNVQYADRLKEAVEYPSMMSIAELRTAERAWLRYREAWVQFGTACWPRTKPDQWRSWLTAQRLDEMG